jgi:Spy/CpxP family protein refolding chaperone
MKHAAYALLAFLTFAAPALAQDTPPTPPTEEGRRGRGGRGGRGGLPIEQLKQELGLTPEQVATAEALSEEMRTAMREAFSSGDMQGGRERIRGLFEETFTKLEAVLTPEQVEKAKAFRAQMNERMQRGPGAGNPGGRGERGDRRPRLREEALSALALGADEAAVVTPLLDAALQARETVRTDAETQRRQLLETLKETTDADAVSKLLEQYRAARSGDRSTIQQAQEQLREVLTLEQEAKLVGLGILE